MKVWQQKEKRQQEVLGAHLHVKVHDLVEKVQNEDLQREDHLHDAVLEENDNSFAHQKGKCFFYTYKLIF